MPGGASGLGRLGSLSAKEPSLLLSILGLSPEVHPPLLRPCPLGTVTSHFLSVSSEMSTL